MTWHDPLSTPPPPEDTAEHTGDGRLWMRGENDSLRHPTARELPQLWNVLRGGRGSYGSWTCRGTATRTAAVGANGQSPGRRKQPCRSYGRRWFRSRRDRAMR